MSAAASTRSAWGCSLALHAGVAALLAGLVAAEAPAPRHPLWEVRLAAVQPGPPAPKVAAGRMLPAGVSAPHPLTPAPPSPMAAEAQTGPVAAVPLASAERVVAEAASATRDTENAVPVPVAEFSAPPPGNLAVTRPAAANPASAAPAPRDAAVSDPSRQGWRTALLDKLREIRRYPPAARRLGQEGVVVLLIEIGGDGELRRAEVSGSSGFPLLDRAATHLIHEAAAALRGRPPFPGDGRLEISIAYRLDG